MPYTSHGHAYGVIDTDQPRPAAVARCGGPGLCSVCAREAGRDVRPSRAYRRFRKRPVEVVAVQWTGDNTAELWDAFSAANIYGPTEKNPDWLIMTTLEGDMRANIGDWIIKGVQGEIYPCKPDIFEATYERVSDGTVA